MLAPLLKIPLVAALLVVPAAAKDYLRSEQKVSKDFYTGNPRGFSWDSGAPVTCDWTWKDRTKCIFQGYFVTNPSTTRCDSVDNHHPWINYNPPYGHLWM